MNNFDPTINVTGFERPMNRRNLLKMLGIGTAALAVSVAGKTGRVSAQSVTQYKTTTALNFRSGPGTSYSIIRVIPAGGIVAHTGTVQNSFYEVGYSGTYGWVHKDYLTPAGGSSDPVIIGSAVTTVALNLRSGPSTSHQVLRVMASGASVQISGTVQNGFRYVVHNGLADWAADQYLASNVPGHAPYDPNFATTTAALNLRAEPSLSARVLLMMPSGARVRMLGSGSGQFAKVDYNGTVGWAAFAYLN
jgi:uncharacterized protein YraI